ncbi:MAG: hypothetical protein M3P10_10345 [Actinomycetota bacterium]|nr:hypothetical protein [Actinomycetota bacterium]
MGYFTLIAVAVLAYRIGVRKGVVRSLELGWRREDRAFVDRLRRTPVGSPTDEDPNSSE